MSKILVLLFLMFVTPILQAKQTLLHYTLSYPPYWVVDGDKLSGYHYNLSKAIYQRAGFTPTFLIMPYARIEAIKNAETTQVLSYGAATAEPSGLLLPVPPTLIDLYAYSMKQKPSTELFYYQDTSIAVKRGFPLGPFSELLNDSAFHTVQLGTVDAAVRLLMYDRVDYVVTLKDPFDSAVENYDGIKPRLQKTNLLKLYGFPIAVNASHPSAEDIALRLAKAYLELVQEGVIVFRENQTLLAADAVNFFDPKL